MALKLGLDVQAAKDLANIRAYLVAEADSAIADRVRDLLRKRMEGLRIILVWAL